MSEFQIVGTVTSDHDFTGPAGPAGPEGPKGADGLPGRDGAPGPSADTSVLGAAVAALTARLDGVDKTVDADFIQLDKALVALEARVKALEPILPPPVPDLDTVHVGAATKVSTAYIGWTTVQETEMTAAVAAILEKCAYAKNQSIIGFGPSSPMQSVEGGPIDWTYLDRVYGAPGSTTGGFFGKNCLRVLTAYGCPPYMRQPRVAGQAPMPVAPDMTPYGESPPHWSQVGNWAKLIAACVDRYQIDIVQEWNEDKGEFTGSTLVAGSVMVPPGSGLPQAGPGTNRVMSEHHTYRFNAVYPAVKAVRPQCKVLGPYDVTRTYLDPAKADSANDAFPFNLHGAWGNADKKIMAHVMYHLEHAVGIDGICLDTKTSANDAPAGTPGGITPENQWSGLQKVLDWQDWLDKLAVFDPVKYGRAKDVPLHFAEAYSRVPAGLNANNHQEAVATDAWSIINYILPSRTEGWMRWQIEGNRGAADSATAHSISLVHAKGSAKSLQPTEAVLVYAGLVEHFPPGTQLYSVTFDAPPPFDIEDRITGIASDTTVCLVSRAADPITLTFKGEPLVLAPYDVRFIAR